MEFRDDQICIGEVLRSIIAYSTGVIFFPEHKLFLRTLHSNK
jgi:hypothetical protein